MLGPSQYAYHPGVVASPVGFGNSRCRDALGGTVITSPVVVIKEACRRAKENQSTLSAKFRELNVSVTLPAQFYWRAKVGKFVMRYEDRRVFLAQRDQDTHTRKIVVERNISPGLSKVEGKLGRLGLSGKCWVSSASPPRFCISLPAASH